MRGRPGNNKAVAKNENKRVRPLKFCVQNLLPPCPGSISQPSSSVDNEGQLKEIDFVPDISIPPRITYRFSGDIRYIELNSHQFELPELSEGLKPRRIHTHEGAKTLTSKDVDLAGSENEVMKLSPKDFLEDWPSLTLFQNVPAQCKLNCSERAHFETCSAEKARDLIQNGDSIQQGEFVVVKSKRGQEYLEVLYKFSADEIKHYLIQINKNTHIEARWVIRNELDIYGKKMLQKDEFFISDLVKYFSEPKNLELKKTNQVATIQS